MAIKMSHEGNSSWLNCIFVCNGVYTNSHMYSIYIQINTQMHAQMSTSKPG